MSTAAAPKQVRPRTGIFPAVSSFEFITREVGRAVTVAVAGELDLDSHGRLEEELRRVEELRPPVLVLDLRELEFMDSTGLRLVVGADSRAREEGRRFVVVRGGEAVSRVFRITRMDERFEMVDEPPPEESPGG